MVLGQDALVLREHQAWLWCSSPHAVFVCSHPQKEGIRPSPKSSKARGSESCLHHTKSKSSLSGAKQSLEIMFFAHGKSPCPSPGIVLGIPAARAGGLTPVLLRDIKHLKLHKAHKNSSFCKAACKMSAEVRSVLQLHSYILQHQWW